MAYRHKMTSSVFHDAYTQCLNLESLSREIGNKAPGVWRLSESIRITLSLENTIYGDALLNQLGALVETAADEFTKSQGFSEQQQMAVFYWFKHNFYGIPVNQERDQLVGKAMECLKDEKAKPYLAVLECASAVKKATMEYLKVHAPSRYRMVNDDLERKKSDLLYKIERWLRNGR